jgi:hypothetical protein
MATTTQYDPSYLSDRTKVRKLATWVLTNTNYFAANARDVLNIPQQTGTPSDALLKKVYGHLFDPGTDVGNLIRAHKG